MQQQAPEGMPQPRSFQQCLPQGQTNVPKGPVKRQVVEAWKKMNEGVDSKTLGSQDPWQCCKHYGFPFFQDKSNKREVKVNLSCEANVDKKRKAVSPEPELGSNQHSSSTTLSHPASIPRQINSDSKESEVSQAKITPLFPPEVCIDGWMITYKEFQPQKIKRAQKRSSLTKMNLRSQQAGNTPSNNYVEFYTTKDHVLSLPTRRTLCYILPTDESIVVLWKQPESDHYRTTSTSDK